MATFTTVRREERGEILESMRVAGVPEWIGEFRKVFGVPDVEGKTNL